MFTFENPYFVSFSDCHHIESRFIVLAGVNIGCWFSLYWTYNIYDHYQNL